MSRNTASPALVIALRWGLPICPHTWRVIATGDDEMAKAPTKTKSTAKPAPAPKASPASQLRHPKPVSKKKAGRGR